MWSLLAMTDTAALSEIRDAIFLLMAFCGPPLFFIAAMLGAMVFNERNPIPEEITIDETD